PYGRPVSGKLKVGLSRTTGSTTGKRHRGAGPGKTWVTITGPGCRPSTGVKTQWESISPRAHHPKRLHGLRVPQPTSAIYSWSTNQRPETGVRPTACMRLRLRVPAALDSGDPSA